MKYVVTTHNGQGETQLEETKSNMLDVIREIADALYPIEHQTDFAVYINVELIAETQEELAEMQSKWA